MNTRFVRRPVPEDASLNDFEDGSGSDTSDDGSGSDTADDGSNPATDEAIDDADADPAASTARSRDPATATYRWSPNGAECPDCGAVTERRWHDGERFVCPACKDW